MIGYLFVWLLFQFAGLDQVHMQACEPGYNRITTTKNQNGFKIEINSNASVAGINPDDLLFTSGKEVSLPVESEIRITPKNGEPMQFLFLQIYVKDIRSYSVTPNGPIMAITVTASPQDPEKWENVLVRPDTGIVLRDVHCVVMKFIEARNENIDKVMVKDIFVAGCQERESMTQAITDTPPTQPPTTSTTGTPSKGCLPGSRPLNISADIKFKRQAKTINKFQSMVVFYGVPVTIKPKGRYLLTVISGREVFISDLTFSLIGVSQIVVQWKLSGKRKTTLKTRVENEVVIIPLPIDGIRGLTSMKITFVKNPDVNNLIIRWIILNGCTTII